MMTEAPGASAIFNAPDAAPPLAPDVARQQISERIADEAFRTRLLSGDQQARADWDNLHGALRPSQAQSQQDIELQMSAGEAERNERRMAHYLQRADYSEEEQRIIRNRLPISEAEQKYARQERERLMRDLEFQAKLRSGNRHAAKAWDIVHYQISAPTFSVKA